MDCARTYVANNGNTTLDRRYPAFLNMDIFPKAEDYPTGQQDEIISVLDRLIPEAQKMAPDAPLLFAICAPCQPFTRIHASELKDDRAEKRTADRNLLLHACRFVERYRPDYILSENVAGISSARFGGVWDLFRKKLEKIGYITGSEVVCASKFGIAQRRKRSILVATRKDLLSEGAPETLYVPKSDPESGKIGVKAVLSDLPKMGAGELHPNVANHMTRGLNALNAKRIRYAPPGGSNAYLEDTPEGDLSLTCHKKVNNKFGARCFGDTYTRMSPNEPSPTITTKCHSFTNGRFGHFDTTQQRCISMREAARLQSFKDDYVFHPANQLTTVAKQIGNAVPPKLASFFATRLISGELAENSHASYSLFK